MYIHTYTIGDMDAARALFTKCTEVNEHNAASWQAWGTMERQAGNREKAAALLERGLRASPKNTWVMQALALLEWERGNTQMVCLCVCVRARETLSLFLSLTRARKWRRGRVVYGLTTRHV